MTSYIPERLQIALDQYLKNRRVPGSFILAVVQNDLKEAINRADRQSLSCLPEIVQYLMSNGGDKWGSKERVREWLESR